MFKKDLSPQELEKLEAEKQERLQKIRDEIRSLNNKRSEILLRMAEEGQTTSRELEEVKAGVAQLETEIEIIEALLGTLPERKDYARGREVEALIPKIAKKAAGISPLIAEIESKSAALMDASKKLLAYLESCDDFSGIKSLRLRTSYLDAGMDGIIGFGRAASGVGMAPGGVRTISMEPVLMHMACDKDKLTSWAETTQTAIEKRLAKMRDHAKRLTGQEAPEPKWPYCPNCFENTGSLDPDAKGMCRCPHCHTVFHWSFGRKGDQNG